MTAAKFRYEPAEDESVDAQFVLISNPNVTIQDARAYGCGWCVNEWIETPNQGSLDHGSFRSFAAAKAKAISVAASLNAMVEAA